ncbi:AMP-binding protein, partial [Streptomyces sp. NPDC058284]|uniref:AMP-binding protein n=1 Tax=unclassified Streptomyces TaxID=2593676 RepID=UPI00364B9C91
MGRLPLPRPVPVADAPERLTPLTAPAQAAEVSEETVGCIWHTSGSTGLPKPVLISHRALASRAAAIPRLARLTPTDRIAQFTAPCFDAVLWEVFGALAAGARLQISAPADRTPGKALPRFLARYDITAFTCTPAHLAAAPFTELPALRRIVCGGETLHPAPLAAWIARYRVSNAYGPTEACVDAVFAEHICPGEDPAPIGCPLPGVRAWVLDEQHHPVAEGQPGELYLGGQGLAEGYLGRPQATEAAFLQLDLPASGGHLEDISFGEPAVTDEGAGDAGEGQEVVGLALV